MSHLEALRSALASLQANLLRTTLTMLGIVIGVAAVIATVAVGAGARAQILEQIKSLGSNLFIVVTGNVTIGGVRLGLGSRLTLSIDDAVALEREIPGIQIASPLSRSSMQVVARNTNWATVLHGVAKGFFEAREWEIMQGRGFSDHEIGGTSKVALLGETVARSLFGDDDPIGETVRIRNVPVTIIGVLARKGQTTSGQDQDDTVLLPFYSARQFIFGINRANHRAVGSILVKVRDGEDMAAVESDMRELLRQRHRLRASDGDDFFIRNLTELSMTRDASARTLAILLSSVAAVSLLVGGIGIMNIMLVSVTERTREIGVRMAVGARRRDILSQFLIEATTLSLIGGIAGVGLGIAAAHLIADLAEWPTLIRIEAIALAVGVSAVIGVFFGYYPSRRAARLDPIEALRHE